MAWPAKTYIDGELMTAAIGNTYWRDPLNDLHAGGIAIASQAANDFIYPTSATQWGRLAAVAGRVPKFNDAGTAWEMANVVENAWPINSIFESFVSTNPNTLLGFGTWSLYGVGRIGICVDAGDVDFDTAGETGGTKTHTLTIAQMPSHTHTQNSHNHTQNPHSHTISGVGNDISIDNDPATDVMDDSGTMTTSSTTATNNAATAVNQNTGSDAAHNNMPPYIALYRWQRTA